VGIPSTFPSIVPAQQISAALLELLGLVDEVAHYIGVYLLEPSLISMTCSVT